MPESKERETPKPEVGEVRALNGLSWTPWVIITRSEPDSAGHDVARFAVLDEMTDDALTPVPDRLVVEIEETVGDSVGRRELAELIDRDPDIDKRWCPVRRLDPLGEPGIQGCDPVEGGDNA